MDQNSGMFEAIIQLCTDPTVQSCVLDPIGRGIDIVQEALPPTVSMLEIVWTVPAAFGLMRYISRYYRAWCGRVSIRNSKEIIKNRSVLLLAATSRCIRFGCLVLSFEILTGAGLNAMTLPQTVNSDPDNPNAWLVVALFLALEFVLVLKGELNDYYAVAIMRLWELDQQEEEETHHAGAA